MTPTVNTNSNPFDFSQIQPSGWFYIVGAIALTFLVIEVVEKYPSKGRKFGK